jgi:hypothetical protein
MKKLLLPSNTFQLTETYTASQVALNSGDRMGLYVDGMQVGRITAFSLKSQGIFAELSLPDGIDFGDIKAEVDYSDPKNPVIIGATLFKNLPTTAQFSPSYDAAIAQREDEDALELAQFAASQKSRVF